MRVYTFRGAGNPRAADGTPSGMVGDVTRRLPGNKFSCYEPDWPAQIGPATGGVSLDSSVGIASVKLSQLVFNHNDDFGIVAYSLGCLGASKFLESGAAHMASDRLKFIVMISNPSRRKGESVRNLAGPSRYGLYGEHKPWPNIGAENVFEYTDYNDLISSAEWDSPLRKVSDAISPFSWLEGGRFGDAERQLKAQKNREQYYMFWQPRWREKYAEAADQMVRYILPYPPYNIHASYAVNKMPGSSVTWTEHAAIEIIRRYA